MNMSRENYDDAVYADYFRKQATNSEKRPPEVVTLCGSSRFPDDHMTALRELTLQGKIVIPLGLFGHVEGLDMEGEDKKKLDELHLRKIDISDSIFVVNPKRIFCKVCHSWADDESHKYLNRYPVCNCDGSRWHGFLFYIIENWTVLPYIGESTKREIEYAKKSNKKIYYLNPMESK
jgi:hypothetical protein